jgi:hypothetical protein
MISTRVAARRLRRLHRGVYAWGHDRLRREGILLAAAFAYVPPAVLSHRTAAAHWGMLPTARADVDVTVEAQGGRADRRGIDLHIVRRLDPRDITEHDGLPITTPARTIVDLAGTRPPRQTERASRRPTSSGYWLPARWRRPSTARLGGRPPFSDGSSRRSGRPPSPDPSLRRRSWPSSGGSGYPTPRSMSRSMAMSRISSGGRSASWSKPTATARTARGAHSSTIAGDVELALRGYNVRRFTYDQIIHTPAETGRRLRLLYDAQ